MPLPAAVPSSPPPGGEAAPWPSFRLPDGKNKATAHGAYVLIVGGLMLACGLHLGAALHRLLVMVG